MEVLLHWKRLWCWEGLGAVGEGDDRGWDGWMALLTRWTWVWVNSGSWWWTGRPGVLQFMGSQRVGHDWATELNWTKLMEVLWFYIRSCHLQTDSFSSSFRIWIHFISFPPTWFIWLGLLVSCWIVMGKVVSCVLFLILEKNFQPFIIEYEVNYELGIYMTFTILKFISPVCWGFLIFFFHKKNSLFCRCVFLDLLRWLYFFLCLILLIWHITLVDLYLLNHPCTTRIHCITFSFHSLYNSSPEFLFDYFLFLFNFSFCPDIVFLI